MMSSLSSPMANNIGSIASPSGTSSESSNISSSPRSSGSPFVGVKGMLSSENWAKLDIETCLRQRNG